MSEPATARAMAFRVEDMEVEERVEALEQWGAELREAGFRAGHAQVHAPEPGVAPEAGFEQRWAKTLDVAEQPSSLVERVRHLLKGGFDSPTDVEVMAVGGATLAFVELAEAINVATALIAVLDTRTHSTNDRLDAAEGDIGNLVDEAGALATRVANLDTKTAHLPFPAAPARSAAHGEQEVD